MKRRSVTVPERETPESRDLNVTRRGANRNDVRSYENNMDEMQAAAAKNLELAAAERKAAASAKVLAERSSELEALTEERRTKASEAAEIEAAALAVEEKRRAEEQAAEDAEEEKQRIYTDALNAEAEARDKAHEDAREVRRLRQEQADMRVPALERTFHDREQLLGSDHSDTVATRNELTAAYEAAGRTPEGKDDVSESDTQEVNDER